MEVKLKGLHRVKKTLAGGSTATYFYAWRGKGAPQLKSPYGTAAFVAEFERLTRHRRVVGGNGTVDDLIRQYKQSPAFTRLRRETQRSYDGYLTKIGHRFGTMPLAALQAPRARSLFFAWHDTMSDTPRAADLSMTVLARLFSWAAKRNIIGSNPLRSGFEKHHSGTRRDAIWSPGQINLILTQGKPHFQNAVQMALWTMQRQGDLLAMTTVSYDPTLDRIRIVQGKGGSKVWIKPQPVLKSIIEDASDRQRILCNSRGENWTSSGFQSSWRKEMQRLGITGVTFHDLRGTAISHAYYTMIGSHDEKIKRISEISGHSRDGADAIIRQSYLAGEGVFEAINGTKL